MNKETRVWLFAIPKIAVVPMMFPKIRKCWIVKAVVKDNASIAVLNDASGQESECIAGRQ